MTQGKINGAMAVAAASSPSAPAAPKRKVGRPKGSSPVYGDDVRQRIITELEQGKYLVRICDEPWAPSFKTVMDWAREDASGFGSSLARARATGYDIQAEKLMELAEDQSGDVIEAPTDANGNKIGADRPNGVAVQRHRLIIDAKKWLLSKVRPEHYGDRVGVEVTGRDGGPIETRDLGLSDLARRLAFVINQGVIEHRQALPGATADPDASDADTVD